LTFIDAFLDFRSKGNDIYILLNGTNHNTFAGCPTTGDGSNKPPCRQDVCVWVAYGHPTTVPIDDTYLTCPDASTDGCGASGSPHWGSRLSIGQPPPGVPPAWYSFNATYTDALPSTSTKICGGAGANAKTMFW
jgi:hypothetical protein